MKRQYDLSSAEGNIVLPPYILRALAKRLKDVLTLPSRESYERLKLCVATRHEVAPRNVVLCNGSDEAIEDIAREFAGTSALVVTPCFERLYEANEKYGTSVAPFHLTEESAFNYSPSGYKSIEQEIKRLMPKTVWICNPGNPTGAICSSMWIEGAARANPQTTFVIDEAFMEIASEDNGLSQVAVNTSNVIVIRSMSKVFGMAGLRVGYLICNSALADRISQRHIMFNINSIALECAVHALRGEGWQAEYAKFRRNRDTLHKFARNNHLHLMNTLPNLNFFCMKIEGISGDELKERFLAAGIRVKSLDRMRGLERQGYCRILIPRSRRQTTTLIQAIKKIL